MQTATPEPDKVSMVDIRPLKRFATERLPPLSPLRDVLLNEKNVMEPQVFLHALQIWLLLAGNHQNIKAETSR